MNNLPKIKDIYSDKLTVQKDDVFITLMNQPPQPKWVKEHPFIKAYKSLHASLLTKALFF